MLSAFQEEDINITVNDLNKQRKPTAMVNWTMPDIKFRNYQQEAIDKTFSPLKLRGYAGVTMPTATGKTIVALGLACALQSPTLVIVQTCGLAYQWSEAVEKFLRGPNGEQVKCGRLFDGHKEFSEITVATWQTLYAAMKAQKLQSVMWRSGNRKPPKHPWGFNDKEKWTSIEPWFWKKFQFLVLDEKHTMSGMGQKALWEVCKNVKARYRLGMSATPMRYDGFGFVMESHFGKDIYTVTRIEMEKKKHITPVVIHMHRGISDSGDWAYEGDARKAKSFVADDVTHNNHVIRLAELYCRTHGSAVIMVEHIKHLTLLKRLAKEQGWVLTDKKNKEWKYSNDNPIRFVTLQGKDPGKRKDQIRHLLSSGALDVVICSNVWSAGIDIPRLGALVLASPFASTDMLQQRLGRLGRKFPGKTFGHLVDFKHQHVALINMDNTRIEYYKKGKYRIEWGKYYGEKVTDTTPIVVPVRKPLPVKQKPIVKKQGSIFGYTTLEDFL